MQKKLFSEYRSKHASYQITPSWAKCEQFCSCICFAFMTDTKICVAPPRKNPYTLSHVFKPGMGYTFTFSFYYSLCFFFNCHILIFYTNQYNKYFYYFWYNNLSFSYNNLNHLIPHFIYFSLCNKYLRVI